MIECVICRSNADAFDTSDGRIYHRCSFCEFIQLAKEFHAESNKELQRYQTHNNTLNDPRYVEYLSSIARNIFLKYEVNSKYAELKVLDFGCGNEKTLEFVLTNNGIDCHSYDLFFFDDKSLLNRVYTNIILIEVIEHLPNPLQILSSLLGQISANGKIHIKTGDCPSEIDKFRTWWYRRDFTHKSFFHKKTFDYIASHFKLKIYSNNLGEFVAGV